MGLAFADLVELPQVVLSELTAANAFPSGQLVQVTDQGGALYISTGSTWITAALGSNAVNVTGAQTVAGVKTFTDKIRSTVGLWVGNATTTSFTDKWRPSTSSDDVRTKIVEFFGQSGAVAGTPQARGLIARYFDRTTEDSAQADSALALMVDLGTPYTQTLPVAGMEGDALTQNSVTCTSTVAGLVGKASGQDTSTHTGKTASIYAAAGGAEEVGVSIAAYYGVYAEAPVETGTVKDKWSFYGRNKIQTEQMIWTGIFLTGSTLAAGVSAGVTAVDVQAGAGVNFATNDKVVIGPGSTSEVRTVSGVATDTLTFTSALSNAHAAGEVVLPTQAANLRYESGTLRTDYPLRGERVLGGRFEIQNPNGTGYVLFPEQTSPPTAPATNFAILYAEDNGSGKTRLMALFPTGAAQQVAIQP